MKNISGCVICGNPKPSKLVIASYCSTCRGVVASIQAEAHKAMRLQGVPRVSGSCVDCGRPATCYDHRYYSMPFEVDPVCSRCNTNRGPALDVVALARERLGIEEETELPAPKKAEVLPDRLQDMEKKAIESALKSSSWNRTQAAKSLGITFRAIRYKIKKLGITA